MSAKKYKTFMLNKRDVIIIIPAFNEALNLTSVLKSAVKLGYPIVVVNDGSSDNTAQVVKHFPVTLLNHAINLGYFEVLKTGILYATFQRAKYIILLDSDGQHPPVQVNQLITRLIKDKVDLVIGSRFLDQSVRYRQSNYLNFLTKLFVLNYTLYTGNKIADTTSGFQAMTIKTAQFLFNNYLTVFPTGNLILLTHHGFKIKEVPVQMNQRRFGKSMYQSLYAYCLIPSHMFIANLVLLLRIIFDKIRQWNILSHFSHV